MSTVSTPIFLNTWRVILLVVPNPGNRGGPREWEGTTSVVRERTGTRSSTIVVHFVYYYYVYIFFVLLRTARHVSFAGARGRVLLNRTPPPPPFVFGLVWSYLSTESCRREIGIAVDEQSVIPRPSKITRAPLSADIFFFFFFFLSVLLVI